MSRLGRRKASLAATPTGGWSGLSADVYGVQGEEAGAFYRYQREASMQPPDGDSGTAWFACLGFILHPLVRLPRSSFLLVGAQFTLGRFAPYWRVFSGSVLGFCALVRVPFGSPEQTRRNLRGIRSQARSPPVTGAAGALTRPELTSFAPQVYWIALAGSPPVWSTRCGGPGRADR